MARVYKIKNNNRLVQKEGTEKMLGVSVITITRRPNYIDEVLNNFFRQDYDKKELIIVLHGSHMNIKKYQNKAKQYKNIKVFQFDKSTHYGICCNFAFDQTCYDYIAIFDDDDYYAQNYLKQSVNIFNNMDCDIVGKKSFYVYFEKNNTLAICSPGLENRYVNQVADSSMVIKRKLLEKLRFPCPQGEGVLTVFQTNCHNQGFKTYSTHRFNYVVHRHPNPNKEHSWRVSEKELLKYSRIVKRDVTDYSKYIVK